MIPWLLYIRWRGQRGPGIGLWVPVILLWLILLPFVIVLGPFAALLLALSHVNPARLFIDSWRFLAAARGTRIEVANGASAFQLRIL